MAGLIFQVHLQDHLTPILKAFNDAMPLGGHAPPLPLDLVLVERNTTRGGGCIRLMPSSQLLAWMASVMLEHENEHRDRERQEAARLQVAEATS